MPRKPRFAPPGYWYHLTQRGNYRQKTFYSAADYQLYLDLLGRHAEAYDVSILSYCLMPNHIHLNARPNTDQGLSACLRAVSGQYSQLLHARLRRHGHLWQSRFYSCLLGTEDYLATALRYVELNPVRARMVETAEQYRWSAAHTHTSSSEIADDRTITWLAHRELQSRFTANDLRQRLQQPQTRRDCADIRAATYSERILARPH